MTIRFMYFDLDEFKCPCCRKNEISIDLVDALDRARGLAKVPFIITSGYRCIAHNALIGGSPTSSHLKGLAADIKTESSRNRFRIIEALLKAGFTRIGIAKTFIHVDIDSEKVPEVIWLY